MECFPICFDLLFGLLSIYRITKECCPACGDAFTAMLGCILEPCDIECVGYVSESSNPDGGGESDAADTALHTSALTFFSVVAGAAIL
jgi:hypothetical protein